MNKETIIKEAGEIVARLILQYKEYSLFTQKLDNLKTEKLKTIARISKEKGTSMGSISIENYPEIKRFDELIALTEIDRQQISDEMTYANPLIWMMYKDRAYTGTQQEIKNWSAFKDHCAPKDYICGKRFRFLEKYFREETMTDFRNLFPDTTPLKDIYTNKHILSLLEDLALMKEWKANEYSRKSGRSYKWKS